MHLDNHVSVSCICQVKDNDKLMSIAACFDTTPSVLKKVNKLTMDFLYPGQVMHRSHSHLIYFAWESRWLIPSPSFPICIVYPCTKLNEHHAVAVHRFCLLRTAESEGAPFSTLWLALEQCPSASQGGYHGTDAMLFDLARARNDVLMELGNNLKKERAPRYENMEFWVIMWSCLFLSVDVVGPL